MEPSTLLALGSAVVQGIGGIIGKSSSKAEINNLLSQRKAFQTPDEVYDILNATQNNAQSGLDPTTLNYLTGSINQTFAASVAAATRLGGDPNVLGELFNQRVNAGFKVGSENASANMTRFSQYLSALNGVAENKAAEWKSEQDILKDKIQAKVGEMRSYGQDIGNALNTAVGALATNETSSMFKTNAAAMSSSSASAKPVFSPVSTNYNSRQWDELGMILNYKGDKNWAEKALPYNDR